MVKDSILVVEDEAIVAMDLSNTLDSLGYEVLSWQKSGEGALDYLKEKQPDLILMDIKLKGEMDGIQAADAIRKQYDLPVIFLTAYSDKETLNRAKHSLPYGYITKSYNVNDLRSTMEMALYKHRMERKLREQQRLHEVSLNSIPAAVITTDADGIIRFYNQTALDFFGMQVGEKLGKPVDSLNKILIDQGEEQTTLRTMAVNNPQGVKKRCSCIIEGGEIPIECGVSPYKNDKGETLGYVFVLRDMREEKKYYELQARLASIVEYSDDAILSLSMEGMINSWNRAAERMFGYSAVEMIGKNFIALTPSFLPDPFPDFFEAMNSGAHHDSFETIRVRKDGSILHVSLMMSPIYTQEGMLNGISVIARDITEKRHLEATVLEMSEKERIRIGQDLHDSLGQHLTGILLNMKFLENGLKKEGNPETLVLATQISDLLREAVQKTRDLAKNLAPPIIETEGIRESLKCLVSTVEDLYRIRADLTVDPLYREPDTSVAIQLYRIAQEAVNNAVKHSGASRISVFLQGEDNELILMIKDNGKGLEKKASGGMGISIMHYRADMIQGDLSVTGKAGKGTTVRCRVPFQRELS